jgi:UDP-glucose 4-epimerase
MSWLVTGGAGYIGSHVVEAFRDAGIPAVVIDDLSSGHREFVPDDVPFIEGTILDTELVAKTMVEHSVTGVMAIAGFKYAGVSVEEPLHTYDQNVTGMVSVLRAMEMANVDRIVFSSSAATYGTPESEIVTEESPTRPESPYGESKLIGEWILRDQARARGIRHTSLRYFNVVGSGRRHLYDTSPHNLFPIVIEALIAGKTPQIFGDDYPTPDGTCIRDYVHVEDLAISHVEAARLLDEGKQLEPLYNLGSGTGLSVREIMVAMAAGTGIDFTPTIGPRRPGDPARIVASGELAARDINWQMRHSVDDMVRSAWEARRSIL